MEINAAQVKELREKTGLGMMICKQALIDNNGSMELAVESLRKQGQVTAAKRAGRTAKQGAVSVVSDASCAILYEVNSETDFVARNDDFIEFIKTLGTVLKTKKPVDIATAKNLACVEFGGVTVDARVTELIGKIGENITFRRYLKIDVDPSRQAVYSYVHGNGKIGVLVKLSATAGLGGEALAQLGKELAMQVAALNPIAVDRHHIAADVLAKEKEIYLTQAQSSGKPEKIWDKIVEGKLVKYYQEITLIEQMFVKNQEISVADHIKETEKTVGGSITVEAFVRYELGAEE